MEQFCDSCCLGSSLGALLCCLQSHTLSFKLRKNSQSCSSCERQRVCSDESAARPAAAAQAPPGPRARAQAACSVGCSQLDITEELLHGSHLCALGHVWSPKPIVKELGHVLGKQNLPQHSLVTIRVCGQSKCRGSLSRKNVLFTPARVQAKAGGGVTRGG